MKLRKTDTFLLYDVDLERAKMLKEGVKMARCWLTGFSAGRQLPGNIQPSIPGEEELRQLQIILGEAITKASLKTAN